MWFRRQTYSFNDNNNLKPADRRTSLFSVTQPHYPQNDTTLFQHVTRVSGQPVFGDAMQKQTQNTARVFSNQLSIPDVCMVGETIIDGENDGDSHCSNSPRKSSQCQLIKGDILSRSLSLTNITSKQTVKVDGDSSQLDNIKNRITNNAFAGSEVDIPKIQISSSHVCKYDCTF